MYFDANGRKIAVIGTRSASGRPRSTGSSSSFTWRIRTGTRRRTGIPPPFYKADRVAEYRQAHAVFSERLRRAQAGESDMR